MGLYIIVYIIYHISVYLGTFPGLPTPQHWLEKVQLRITSYEYYGDTNVEKKPLVSVYQAVVEPVLNPMIRAAWLSLMLLVERQINFESPVQFIPS